MVGLSDQILAPNRSGFQANFTNLAEVIDLT